MGRTKYLDHLEPATSIIKKFGGVTEVSKITGVSINTVSRWRNPKDKHDNGTGGVIPFKYIAKLLAEADAQGMDLDPGDFIPKPDEIA